MQLPGSLEHKEEEKQTKLRRSKVGLVTPLVPAPKVDPQKGVEKRKEPQTEIGAMRMVQGTPSKKKMMIKMTVQPSYMSGPR